MTYRRLVLCAQMLAEQTSRTEPVDQLAMLGDYGRPTTAAPGEAELARCLQDGRRGSDAVDARRRQPFDSSDPLFEAPGVPVTTYSASLAERFHSAIDKLPFDKTGWAILGQPLEILVRR